MRVNAKGTYSQVFINSKMVANIYNAPEYYKGSFIINATGNSSSSIELDNIVIKESGLKSKAQITNITIDTPIIEFFPIELSDLEF